MKMINYNNWKIKVRDIMRYSDVGDYQDNKKEFSVYSKLNNKEQALVLAHEIIEAISIHLQGLTSKDIDDCDKNIKYPSYSVLGKYDRGHLIAKDVEKQLAQLAGIDWYKYRTKINNLKIKNKDWKE